MLKPGGVLLITTRSFGFGYHAYPHDFWRFELDDMRALFSDCSVLDLATDPLSPGVFVKVRKPVPFVEADLEGCQLYSMVSRRRKRSISDTDIRRFHLRQRILRPFLIVERWVRRVRDRVRGRRSPPSANGPC